MTPCLRRCLGFRLWVVVDALGLEEDGAVGVAPEVSDWVAAVTTTRHQLQATFTVRVGTRFT